MEHRAAFRSETPAPREVPRRQANSGFKTRVVSATRSANGVSGNHFQLGVWELLWWLTPRKALYLADFQGIPHNSAGFMRVSGRPPAIGADSLGISPAGPHKETAVNKAELTSALAMRTKMSKADASRTIDALFDDKGIIAGELKKGAKVQITGFGNFEARKRAARMGRNPKTGGTIQIKASIAPAFRAGKQLKMALNGKR